MSSRTLAQRVVTGSIWMAASRILVRLIGLVSTLILARVLTPGDFGIVALASALYFVIQTVSDLRFEQALISLRDKSDVDFDTAWTMNVLRGLAGAVVLLIVAYPYAQIMADPRLVGVVAVLAAVAIVHGLKNPHFLRFEIAMDFRKEFTLQVVAKFAGFCVALWLALQYRNYWALLAGMLASTAIEVVMSYVLRPSRPRPTLASLRRLMGFSGWLMGGQLVTAVIGRVQYFLVGAYLPSAVVGLLHVGAEIAQMATTETLTPLRRALLPALAQKSNDAESHREAFREAMAVIIGLALPIGCGISLVADLLVPVLLGPQWLGAIEVIRYVGVAGAVTAISAMGDTMLISAAKTRPLFQRELLKLAYLLPGYWLGITYGGLSGVLIAWLGLAMVSLAINIRMIRQHVGVGARDLFGGAWRTPVAVLGMAGFVWLTKAALVVLGSGVGADLVRLLITVLVGAASYVLLHLLLWRLAGRPQGFERRMFDVLHDLPGMPSRG